MDKLSNHSVTSHLKLRNSYFVSKLGEGEGPTDTKNSICGGKSPEDSWSQLAN